MESLSVFWLTGLTLCGISWFLSIVLIWSRVLMSGERPPWTQRTVWSIRAATVRKSKTLPQLAPISSTSSLTSSYSLPAAIPPGVAVSVLVLTLVIEPVNLSYLPWLMVASEQGYFVRPLRLEHQQSCERLQAVVTSVNKISHEDVVSVGTVATSSKQFLKKRINSHLISLLSDYGLCWIKSFGNSRQ